MLINRNSLLSHLNGTGWKHVLKGWFHTVLAIQEINEVIQGQLWWFERLDDIVSKNAMYTTKSKMVTCWRKRRWVLVLTRELFTVESAANFHRWSLAIVFEDNRKKWQYPHPNISVPAFWRPTTSASPTSRSIPVRVLPKTWVPGDVMLLSTMALQTRAY